MTKPTPTYSREAHLWPIIKRVFPERCERLETGATASGIPDVLYVQSTYHGFIEMKIAHWRRGGKLNIRWRAGQLAWLKKHDTLAGAVWVLFTTEAGVLWLVAGRYADRMRETFSISDISEYATECGTIAHPNYTKLQSIL